MSRTQRAMFWLERRRFAFPGALTCVIGAGLILGGLLDAPGPGELVLIERVEPRPSPASTPR